MQTTISRSTTGSPRRLRDRILELCLLCCAFLAVWGCAPPSESGESTAPVEATPAPEPEVDLDAIADAVDAPDRPDADRDDDSLRKPAEVLAAFGVRPGMTVLDLFAGSGYYTEILSNLVGPEGRVIAHTNAAYEGFLGNALSERVERLDNVEFLHVEANDLDLAPHSLDAAILVLTYHDFYWKPENQSWDIDGNRLLGEIRQALKPGGTLGIVDHSALAGAATDEVVPSLHRIDEAVVRADLAAARFELESESDALRNPDDERTIAALDPAIRRKTDRFVLNFRRPEVDEAM